MFISKYLYFLLKIFAEPREKPADPQGSADPRLGSTALGDQKNYYNSFLINIFFIYLDISDDKVKSLKALH